MHWKATIQNTIYHSQVNVELSLTMVSEVKVQEEPMAKMKVRAISVPIHCKRPSVPFGKYTLIAKTSSYYYNISYSLVCNNLIWPAETELMGSCAPPSIKT